MLYLAIFLITVLYILYQSPLMVLKKFQDSMTRFAFGKEKPVLVDSFYACTDKLINGTEKDMKDYSNKVLIVTNVASK